MKKFGVPTISIQKLEPEDILTASSCFVEALACTACYCTIVQCPTGYECTGLVCEVLNDI